MRAGWRTDSQKFGGWDRFGPSVSVATPYFEERPMEMKLLSTEVLKQYCGHKR